MGQLLADIDKQLSDLGMTIDMSAMRVSGLSLQGLPEYGCLMVTYSKEQGYSPEILLLPTPTTPEPTPPGSKHLSDYGLKGTLPLGLKIRRARGRKRK